MAHSTPTLPQRRRPFGGAISPSAVWTRTREGGRWLRSGSGVALLLSLAFLVPPRSIRPGADLDPSWMLQLNRARSLDLHFGSDLQFTYGPWGFLDVPLAVSRGNIVLGVLFAVVAVSVGWAALWSAGRTWLPRTDTGACPLAAALATVVLIVSFPLVGPSAVLLVGAALGVAQFIGLRGRARHGWVPAAAAAAAALSLQIKFSEGVVLAVAAAAAGLLAPHARLRRSVEVALVFVAGTVVAWLLAGQRLGDLASWFVGSARISSGYPDAMGVERQPNGFSYLLIGSVGVFVLAATLAHGRREGWRRGIGVAIVVLAVGYLGFRQATVRHGSAGEPFYYLTLIPAFAYVVGKSRAASSRAIAIGLVLVLAWNGGTHVDPREVQNRWAEVVEVATSPEYQRDYLALARDDARRFYGVPETMIETIGRSPVNIDGTLAGVPWAYGLRWRPMPVFQSYVAYTAELDALNATWLRDAPRSQYFLRPPVTRIDIRNTLWDSPRYLTTELCRTRTVEASPRWLLLRKSGNRCGTAVAGESRRVTAGQQVDVPAAGPGELVTMSFEPDVSLATKALSLVFKPPHPLLVRADGEDFQLPRDLAGGPLPMNVPTTSGWPALYGGGSDYSQVSFNDPGTVTFSVRTLR